MMTAPFSQVRSITAMMILANIALTVGLTVLSPANSVVLWAGWVVSGLLTYSIWNVISRFDLKGGRELRVYAICWPLLSATLDFSCCHFGYDSSTILLSYLQLIVQMLVINLIMTVWQKRSSTAKHLIIGLLIGGISTLLPHTLLWLLFVPIASYHLRCWSMRNMFSAITGCAFAIWMAYCIYFFCFSPEAAAHLLPQYSIIIRDENFHQLTENIGLWQILYLALVLLLLITYSFLGMFSIASQSVRASSSIQFVSSIMLLLAVLLWLDIEHLLINTTMLVMLISLQLAVIQANIRSFVHEWWTLLVIILFITLSVAPYFI